VALAEGAQGGRGLGGLRRLHCGRTASQQGTRIAPFLAESACPLATGKGRCPLISAERGTCAKPSGLKVMPGMSIRTAQLEVARREDVDPYPDRRRRPHTGRRPVMAAIG